jgi:hypothetical protein
MPVSGEDAPGSTGPDSFGARQAYDSADKYAQAGRVVPGGPRRHLLTGRSTADHPHKIAVDVARDANDQQAAATAQTATGQRRSAGHASGRG